MSIADTAGLEAGRPADQAGKLPGPRLFVTAQDAQRNHVGQTGQTKAVCLTRYVTVACLASHVPHLTYAHAILPIAIVPFFSGPTPIPQGPLSLHHTKRKRVPEMCLTGGRTCIAVRTRHSGTAMVIIDIRYVAT